MLHKPRVKKSIQRAWHSPYLWVGASVADRIRLCRKALSGWKKKNNTNYLDKIQELQIELEKEQSAMKPNFFHLNRIKREMLMLIEKKMVFGDRKQI